MIKLFGVSVWIHSIFILILGVLLLLYTIQGDTKEGFQATSTTSTAASGSASGSAVILGPGASESGAAYDLTKCVPGYRNSLGSGIFLGSYNAGTYSIEDCPIIKIQMDSLKNMAKIHLEGFESTSLRGTQEQLCSLNISYLETGCNASNSTMKSGSEYLTSTFGSYLGSYLGSSIPLTQSPPPPLPTNIITGSMTLNTSEITLSSSATDVVKVGSVVYLGDYPTTYNGPYYITNISASGTVLTTSATNIVSTVSNVKVYWSPALGRSNTPVRREGTNSIARINIYTGYRYIVMDDTDDKFPANVEVGTPLYLSNCSTTSGPYLAASKPTSDRILFGHYIGSDAKRLGADGTFTEASILNGNMFFPLYARPIPLSIKEVYLISGAQATAASTCAKYGGTVATAAQITIARQNGADLSEEATSAVCWGNRPPHSSELLIPFSSTKAADSVGVPYVASNRTPCTIGMFSRDGNCFPCPGGYFCPENATFPQACPFGTYNPSLEQYTAAICETCPPGTICPPGTDIPLACPVGFICKGGTYIDRCPTGYYNPYFGAENTSKIVPCPPGKYCPLITPIPVACAISPAGPFEEVECPPGHYCPAFTSNPVPCPDGTFSETVGNTGPEFCLPCPPGYYSDAGTEKCAPCTEGYYCPGNSNRIICPRGTYCPDKFMTQPIGVCTYPGIYTDNSVGRTQLPVCEICPSGHYCPNGLDKYECPAGTSDSYGRRRWVNDSSFFNSPTRPFTNTARARPYDSIRDKSVSINDCKPCYAGTFCKQGKKAEGCPKGHYCPPNSSEAIPCSDPSLCKYVGTIHDNNEFDRRYCPVGHFYLYLSDVPYLNWQSGTPIGVARSKKIQDPEIGICPEPIDRLKFRKWDAYWTDFSTKDFVGTPRTGYNLGTAGYGYKTIEDGGQDLFFQLCYPHWEDCL